MQSKEEIAADQIIKEESKEKLGEAIGKKLSVFDKDIDKLRDNIDNDIFVKEPVMPHNYFDKNGVPYLNDRDKSVLIATDIQTIESVNEYLELGNMVVDMDDMEESEDVKTNYTREEYLALPETDRPFIDKNGDVVSGADIRFNLVITMQNAAYEIRMEALENSDELTKVINERLETAERHWSNSNRNINVHHHSFITKFFYKAITSAYNNILKNDIVYSKNYLISLKNIKESINSQLFFIKNQSKKFDVPQIKNNMTVINGLVQYCIEFYSAVNNIDDNAADNPTTKFWTPNAIINDIVNSESAPETLKRSIRSLNESKSVFINTCSSILLETEGGTFLKHKDDPVDTKYTGDIIKGPLVKMLNNMSLSYGEAHTTPSINEGFEKNPHFDSTPRYHQLVYQGAHVKRIGHSIIMSVVNSHIKEDGKLKIEDLKPGEMDSYMSSFLAVKKYCKSDLEIVFDQFTGLIFIKYILDEIINFLHNFMNPLNGNVANPSALNEINRDYLIYLISADMSMITTYGKNGFGTGENPRDFIKSKSNMSLDASINLLNPNYDPEKAFSDIFTLLADFKSSLYNSFTNEVKRNGLQSFSNTFLRSNVRIQRKNNKKKKKKK